MLGVIFNWLFEKMCEILTFYVHVTFCHSLWQCRSFSQFSRFISLMLRMVVARFLSNFIVPIMQWFWMIWMFVVMMFSQQTDWRENYTTNGTLCSCVHFSYMHIAVRFAGVYFITMNAIPTNFLNTQFRRVWYCSGLGFDIHFLKRNVQPLFFATIEFELIYRLINSHQDMWLQHRIKLNWINGIEPPSSDASWFIRRHV